MEIFSLGYAFENKMISISDVLLINFKQRWN